MENVLSHPSGGLKNIPTSARRVAFLNQADTPELCEKAGKLALKLLSNCQCVIVASLKNKNNPLNIPTIGAIYMQDYFFAYPGKQWVLSAHEQTKE
jgi:hypothetical protein